jgi:DNA-binding MarR family transcriptional regulator
VVARAGEEKSASRELLNGAEELLLAAFEEGLTRLSMAVAQAAVRERRWLDRVRSELVALLGFLDDEPGWSRLLFLPAPAGSAVALDCERRVLRLLATLLHDGGGSATKPAAKRRLTTELVVGGVFSLIRARISDPDGDGGRLVELAPSLVSFIAVAYRGQALASAALAEQRASAGPPSARGVESGVAHSRSLPIPLTRRTTLVLHAIAHAPRSSNREIAAVAGIGDEGQASHLLRRLARRGLIEKVTPRNGSRRENAWMLTTCGRRVIDLIGAAGAEGRRAPMCASTRQAA